ncbi:hypothetical protein CSPX01_17318 [Colletotrichum filicis]|nr:hypothetical protein CSPX01_17318 [Colletotrichum filicis]
MAVASGEDKLNTRLVPSQFRQLMDAGATNQPSTLTFSCVSASAAASFRVAASVSRRLPSSSPPQPRNDNGNWSTLLQEVDEAARVGEGQRPGKSRRAHHWLPAKLCRSNANINTILSWGGVRAKTWG